MGGPEPRCPRCGQALRPVKLAGVDMRFCASCKAALPARVDLVRLLEAMSVELLADFDPDTPLAPVPATGGAVACPVCGRPMVREDYCGAGLVHFDCCETCDLLWLGNLELGTMTLMWARMEKRLARTQEQTREALAEADAFVTNVQLGDKLGVDRKTPEAFAYALGDRVGGFLSRALHPTRR